MAVCSESGWGDGSYPVYVEFNSAGRVAKLEIIFDGENEEEEEEIIYCGECGEVEVDCYYVVCNDCSKQCIYCREELDTSSEESCSSCEE